MLSLQGLAISLTSTSAMGCACSRMSAAARCSSDARWQSGVRAQSFCAALAALNASSTSAWVQAAGRRGGRGRGEEAGRDGATRAAGRLLQLPGRLEGMVAEQSGALPDTRAAPARTAACNRKVMCGLSCNCVAQALQGVHGRMITRHAWACNVGLPHMGRMRAAPHSPCTRYSTSRVHGLITGTLFPELEAFHSPFTKILYTPLAPRHGW